MTIHTTYSQLVTSTLQKALLNSIIENSIISYIKMSAVNTKVACKYTSMIDLNGKAQSNDIKIVYISFSPMLKYIVEYTMNIAAKTEQNDMQDKMYKLLINPLNISNFKVILESNFIKLTLPYGNKVQLITTYKDCNDLCIPAKITIRGVSNPEDFIISGNNKIIDIYESGTYIVTSGEENITIEIEDSAIDQQETT